MEPTPRDEMDSLLDMLLPFAQQQLEKHREFFPFAASIDSSGTPAMVAVDPPERQLRLKVDVRRVGGQVVGRQTPRESPALISGAPRVVRQCWKQNALVIGDPRSFKSYDGSSFALVDLDASKCLCDRNPLLCPLVHVASLSHALVLPYGPASVNVP
jgi:hypothetical protein